MKKPVYKTREDWLKAAAARLQPRFSGTGSAPAEKLEALVSWPRGGSKTAIGQCFPGKTWTADDTTYVTVSPILGADPARVLDVLLHEMIHACGINGHGKDFRKVATALGLEGKMRATVAGAALRADLVALAKELGPYPHVLMKAPRGKEAAEGSKNTVKLRTSHIDGYHVWMSPKQFAKHGAPMCPVSGKPMEPVS